MTQDWGEDTSKLVCTCALVDWRSSTKAFRAASKRRNGNGPEAMRTMRKGLPTVSCRLDQADYHIHPDYSKDATGSIDDYCRRALELGLAEVCFTTHYDRDPMRKEVDPFMRVDGKLVSVSEKVVKRYIRDIRDADNRYRSRGLLVKAGLEVDYAPHYESILKDELAGYDLDYILGAVHCLDHMAITSSDEAPDCFSHKKMEDMVAEYYGVVAQAVESGLFDAMAHLDIYRKYGLGFYGEGILTAHRGLVEPVLKIMANDDVGLEINAGVLRRGHAQASPSLEIVDLALSLGVRLVAFGSDAHKVEQLGLGIEDSFRAVEKIMERRGVR
jgi:histidinol-phosphatase (PHP family)